MLFGEGFVNQNLVAACCVDVAATSQDDVVELQHLQGLQAKEERMALVLDVDGVRIDRRIRRSDQCRVGWPLGGVLIGFSRFLDRAGRDGQLAQSQVVQEGSLHDQESPPTRPLRRSASGERWKNPRVARIGRGQSLAVLRGEAPKYTVNKDVIQRPGFQAKLGAFRKRWATLTG